MKRTKRTKNKNQKIKKNKSKATNNSTNSSERGLYKINKHVYSVLFGIIVLVSSIYFMPSEKIIKAINFNIKTFYLISILFAFLISFGISTSQNKKTRNLITYSFLALLIFSIAVSFTYNSGLKDVISLFTYKFRTIQSYLTIPTAALGILSLWMYKDKLNETVDKLFRKQNTELQDGNETKSIFLETVKKMFSKKEAFTKSALFLIIGLSIFTLFYKLDYIDLYSDEEQVTQGAMGYYKTGNFEYWDFVKAKSTGVKYNRAKPHQFIVALSYQMFGVSTWSSRFPSALLGVLFIILLFFTARYFIKDRIAVLLIIFSYVFFYEFLLLQRWTRMYAMLVPAFMLAALFTFKFIEGKNKLKFLNINLVSKYFNYNYIYLPFMLIVIVFNIFIHVNSSFILPALLLYSIVVAIAFREKKYIAASIIGLLALTYYIFFPVRVGTKWFTFFDVNHSKIYTQFLLGFPFSSPTNIILILTGTASLFLIKNKTMIKRFLFLLVIFFGSWVMFSFIINYSYSARYVSYIIPFSVILIIGFYSLITKTLYNKIIQTVLSLTLVGFVLLHFNSRYSELYVKSSAAPTKARIAYKTVVDNCKKGEIIYQHWGPAMYYQGIDTSVTMLKLWHRNLRTVIDSIKTNPGTWIVWSSHNGHSMNKDVMDFSNLFFKKYHGFGVDNTNVEVFYATPDMLKDSAFFKIWKNLPNANLNLNKAYSVSFWIQAKPQRSDTPLLFFEDTTQIISLHTDSITGKLICKYITGEQCISSTKIANNKNHHIVWFQEGGNPGDKFGLYIDGKIETENKLKTKISNLIKFRYNLKSRAFINDIRIYNFVLNENQVAAIIKDNGNLNSTKLKADNKAFNSLFLWQQKK